MWKDSMVKGLLNGINLIDMASSYNSEAIVKAALAEAAKGCEK